ncbi:MAG: tetratricopeptide repeat protein [Pleurocapsa sp.]
MKSNFSRLAKIIICLLVIGVITGGSFYVIAKYFQLQQLYQAKNLLNQKKYAAAIEAYDRLLQSDISNSHLLWINRGSAWSGLKQYDQMLQSCSTATLIKPNAPMGWNCRGEALYHLERLEDALKAFERAIALEAEEATFWLNQSRVLARLQQHSQAIAASEQAIGLLLRSPENPTNRHNLAIAFEQKGQSWLKLNQNQQALSAFEQSLAYLPAYLSALQGQGIARYRLGHYTEAITAFAEILQRDDLSQEQQAINWLYKGISLCETPKAVAAKQAFEQVLQLTTELQAKAIAQAGCGIR